VSDVDVDNVNNMQPFDTGSFSSWFAAAHPTQWTDFTFFPSLLFQFYAVFGNFVLILCARYSLNLNLKCYRRS